MFDVSLQGACSYILTEDYCGGQGTFVISAENVPCGAEAVSCTKSIKITIHDTVIHLLRGARPVTSRNPLAPPNSPKAKYEIKEVGLFMFLFTEHGKWYMC